MANNNVVGVSPPNEVNNVHCEGGAFVGGDWVPIEDCAKFYNIKGAEL